jgi:hypothetical protein
MGALVPYQILPSGHIVSNQVVNIVPFDLAQASLNNAVQGLGVPVFEGPGESILLVIIVTRGLNARELDGVANEDSQG